MHIPANTTPSPNVILMLGHRLRRWPNIKITLGKGVVFSGIACTYCLIGTRESWVMLVRVADLLLRLQKNITQTPNSRIKRAIYDINLNSWLFRP